MYAHLLKSCLAYLIEIPKVNSKSDPLSNISSITFACSTFSWSLCLEGEMARDADLCYFMETS